MEAEEMQRLLKKDDQELARKLADLMGRYFNTYSDRERADLLVKEVSRQHRTLQQSIGKYIIAQIKAWAETEHYDLRNEATVMLCRKIMENLKDEETHLPMI